MVRDLVGLVHRLLDTQGATSAPTPEHPAPVRVVADDPRRPLAVVHDVADGPRSTDRREGARDLQKTPGKPLPPSSHSVRGVRDIADAGHADTGPTESHPAETRSEVRLLELVGPLVRLAERANGLTDVHRLADALGPYTDEQIRQAVDKTAALARHGTFTSPIGWISPKPAKVTPSSTPRPWKPHIPPSMNPPFPPSQPPSNQPTPTPKRR